MPDVGRTAPDKTHTQSVVFWKDKGWTEASSRKWCKDHGYYTDGMDETDTQFRWRQYDPDSGKFDYRNKEIQPNSIFLVIGYPKSGGNEANMNETDMQDQAEQQAEAPVTAARVHDPIRCFEGAAKPHEPFWRFRDAADGAEAEMELYGYISEYSWMDDDVTPKMFKDDLYAHGNGGPITVRLNSYGGDVIAASLMRTIIQDYPGFVTVQIDGVAASAATVVATAGDLVRIQDTAYYMIHDPMASFFMATLNIEELTRMVSTLGSIKDGIINAYEQKTGLPRLRLSRMMQDETWMSAQEAVDLGFANEIVTAGQKSAMKAADKAAFVNALSRYGHVPEALRAREPSPRETLRDSLDKFYERRAR